MKRLLIFVLSVSVNELDCQDISPLYSQDRHGFIWHLLYIQSAYHFQERGLSVSYHLHPSHGVLYGVCTGATDEHVLRVEEETIT